MNFENIVKILTGFITYGIPVLSFLWQIKSDFSDKKQIESIVSNFNYQNNSNFDFKDINIQNGYIQVNNPQNINIELRKELDKFEKDRLEDKKFLSNNLYRVSFLIIFFVYILNLINNDWNDFKNISSVWETSIIKNNLVLSFDATLKQVLLMAVIYIILVVIKYLLDKQSRIKTLGFILAFVLYLFTYLEIKDGFIRLFKYPIILSDFSMIIISFLVASIVLLLLFFSLKTLIERLFNLILVYKSKIKTTLINTISSISVVIAPIFILVIKFIFK
ncbi:hypothetical protein [Streptococcus anginosus]|uniref:SepS1 n=1 Tax=Streptococcus anginosus TaxID=1328 RepID=A0A448AID2_STRAP|nr:hypothetical protein [Streptococcus anginosus]EGL47589.1 hypothetical protein HMPREF9966_1930 [Streptococcus anginosus SK52 = DSM 20563]MBZ2157902.1 hypothetical protein [Streptococcus anginosus]ORE83159.1 hypothetical protein B6C93_00715 [Streptococcus anginosus SK52 = DSM 20563]UEB01304.1 hypothetical protein LK450_04855 [Streptococcus anginosus subsp. anginosus]VED98164.1 sepS1 [Streptococcus anginosus]